MKEPRMPKTTKLTTIKYADFVALVEKTTADLEKAPDAEAAELLKSNIEAVKDQTSGRSPAADEIVAIQSVVKLDVEARLSALESKVAELSNKISSAATAGEGQGGTTKAEKGVAQDLAMEALEALISKVNGIRPMIEGGTFNNDEFNKMFDGWWSCREAISTYGTIAAATKLAEATAAKAEKDAAEKAEAEKAAYEKMTAEEKKAADDKKAAEKAEAEKKEAAEKAEAEAKAKLDKGDGSERDKAWDLDIAGKRRDPRASFAAMRNRPAKPKQ
jgi:hypothetical protein